MDDNRWEDEGGAVAPVKEQSCAACGAWGIPLRASHFTPNAMLCEDAYACLDRVNRGMFGTIPNG